jgi:hypothetical protein
MTLTGVGTFCDRCADRHFSTGWPALPEPPELVTLTGPDGRHHLLRFRLSRTPSGIAVDLVEGDGVGDGGYRFSMLGSHDADPEVLMERLVRAAAAEIGQPYLRRASHRSGWVVADQVDEVAGYLVFNPEGGPYRAAVDGRILDWAELGEALESYERWRFRLTMEEPREDVRPDAEVVALPIHRHPSAG